jgi:hypothetical protein
MLEKATHDLFNEVKFHAAEVATLTSLVENGADIEAQDREQVGGGSAE